MTQYIGLALLATLFFWILPLILGLRLAKKKGITRKWMLFGIHPFLAWIGYLVIAVSKAKRECPHCYAKINVQAEVCHICMRESAPQKEEDRHRNLHIGLAITSGPVVLIALFGIMMFQGLTMFKDSWVYEEAWKRMESSPQAQGFLGGNVKSNPLGGSQFSQSGNKMRLSMGLQGDSAEGKLIAAAHRSLETWYMDTLYLIDYSKLDTLDLSDEQE
jgi:hypothetical protein